MLLSKALNQVRQFLATWYSADLEESPAAAPAKVANIDVLADDMRSGWQS